MQTIEIKCPFCDAPGGLMDMHRHLVDKHLGLVETEYEEATGHMRYVIACPICPLKYQHRIKPRYRDPGFLSEHKIEIAMVAFDQLLYHLAREHSAEIGLELPPVEPEG